MWVILLSGDSQRMLADQLQASGMPFELAIDDFPAGGSIPKRFTCDGENVSPAMHWVGEPPETKSFVLIVDDPDAPGGTWNHWLLWDIPSDAHSLDEGGSRGREGVNDFGAHAYGGPCPPRGHGPHRYFFRVFALDIAILGLSQRARRPALEKLLREHTIAEATYMGIYERR